MAPAVTAIIPTYNRPHLIGHSIESALAQTFDDLVVLVGDNGGSPLTEDIVRSYDDPRVRYIRHPSSLGGQGNFLALVERADTPLVASLHDDDSWEPDFLEKTLPLLEDQSISIGFSDFWTVGTNGDRLVEHSEWLTRHSGRDHLVPGRLDLPREELLRCAVLRGASQPAYAGVVRRRAILNTRFPPEVDPLYDLWLNYSVVMRGEGLAYVPERLTNYRVWPGSITAVGYGDELDAAYHHIIAENAELTDLVDDIERDWSSERFRRGWNALDDPTRKTWAQAELRRATPGLSGPRWLAAEAAGRSELGWHTARLARAGVRYVRGRRSDLLDSSGLPVGHMTPTDEAMRLRQ